MPGSRLNVHLFRDSFNTPWGFRLQGGKDLHQPLTVQRVFSNSPAEGELQRGDIILSINNRDASQLTHKQAQDLIKHGGGQVQLVVNRPPPGAHVGPLSPPIVTQKPRAPSLQPPAGHHGSVSYGFQPTKVTLNKYGGSGPVLGSDYSQKGYGQTAAQRYEPRHDKSAMLNRIQSSLDNLHLSPRSPEAPVSSPFYQPYEPPYQQPYEQPYYPPQEIYTPTGLLLEQQRLQEAQPDGEVIAPVWERRRQFQEPPVHRPAVRAPGKKPPPKFSKPPQTVPDLGADFSRPSGKHALTGWRPAPHFNSPSAHNSHRHAPPASKYSQPNVHSTPPAWQRQEEQDTGTPAWRSSLKATGPKPWELDPNYASDEQQASRSPNPGTNESGERDWTQSAVLQFINQEGTRKDRLPPPTIVPKPHSPVHAPRSPIGFYQDSGTSAF